MKVLLYMILLIYSGLISAEDDFLSLVEGQIDIAEQLEEQEYRETLKKYLPLLRQLEWNYPAVYNSFYKMPIRYRTEILNSLSQQDGIYELKQKIINFQRYLLVKH